MNKFTSVLVLFVLAVINLESITCNAIDNSSFPIVFTRSGSLQGVKVTIPNTDETYLSFKGIPYAEPPVGKLRFRAPVAKKPWTNVRDASKHGSMCGSKYGFLGVPQTIGGSEDCLFLNVYTPCKKGKLPVMFWIHGGAYISGSGSTLFYGPDYLIQQDVVVVTVNYRFSAFGFLSTGDKHAPGNSGLKDMVLALQWVRDNIAAFGGDPGKVTIFGQSAGGASVDYLMLSKLSKGLFHRAILQSGSALMPFGFQPDPLTQAKRLGTKLSLSFNSTKDLMEQLRAVSYDAIVAAENSLTAMTAPWGLRPFDFVPSVDALDSNEPRFLTKSPIDLLLKGDYQKVPVIAGGTNGEGLLSVPYLSYPPYLSAFNQVPNYIVPSSYGLAANSADETFAIQQLRDLYFGGRANGTLLEWINLYTDQLIRFSTDRAVRFYAQDSKHPVYYYDFRFIGSASFYHKLLGLANFAGACHADDLFYLFEPELDGFEADAASVAVRNQMVQMWTNFAKTG